MKILAIVIWIGLTLEQDSMSSRFRVGLSVGLLVGAKVILLKSYSSL
jgi:hypothetical protein